LEKSEKVKQKELQRLSGFEYLYDNL
jgi:hypothetical protein